MKYLKQFAIILTISFAGELLNHWIPFPIPASVYGIGILFVCLWTKRLPLEAVEEAGDFLIQIMPIMFVPAAVGLMDSWGIIKDSYLKYLAVICLTTVAVMAVSGRVTQYYVNRMQKKMPQEEESHV